ncbi:MAG TPA: AAA family ATPase, partial [Coleofasciculaceae cyanobacterium]
MPLICLEGASAVGKTTTSKALAERYGAYIVPEVNQLFQPPTPEPIYWYFERQVERWTLAQSQLKNHDLVVLDGDPFQPLWYNWAFDFVDCQPLSVLT